MAANENDFRHPRFDELDKRYAELVGVPFELMRSIRVNGERTNNDVKAKGTGASGVNQITPQTRDLFLKRYGVDAYLSDANAAHVKALHLKESLDRNSGDYAAAAAEYISGPSGKNRGSVTEAYVRRVSGRSLAGEMAAKNDTGINIGAIYQAYKAGKMAPEDAQAFEADVASGKLVLPKGMDVKAPPKPAAPAVDKVAIIEAYTKGRMSEEDSAAFEADLNSGAFTLPKGYTTEQIKKSREGRSATEELSRQIGLTARAGAEGVAGAIGVFADPIGVILNQVLPPDLQSVPLQQAISEMLTRQGVPTPESETERIVQSGAQAMAGTASMAKAAQAVSQAVTSPTTRQVLKTLAEKPLEQITAAATGTIAGKSAEESGAGTAGQIAATLLGGAVGIPLASMAPSAISLAKQGAKQAIRPAVVKAVEKLDAMRAAKPTAAPAVAPTAGTGGSAGAAGTDAATVRQMAASELPVPINLTEGQATRQFGAQQFEREVVKQEIGAPIRERFAEQNRQLVQNFDAFIDETGAAAVDKRSVGESVDAALKKRIERDKAEIRVAYKEAEKAGEMAGDVELTGVSDYLNKNRSGRSSAPIMKALEDEAFVQEVAEGSLADGTFKLRTMTLKQAEELRKSINRNIDPSKPNDMRVAAELKSLIDDATEGMGGDLYKKARQLRSTYSENFSNNVLIRNIVGLKRGSTDRAIALEDVFQKSMLNSSLDDVKNLHRVLRESGDIGEQAWRDLRGQTLSHIRDQMTKNIARDTQGNPIPSAAALDRAITQLDSVGKLDYIFGKKGAEQLRLLNDVAKDVLTAPPGAVNTSNTASAILAAIDMMISGASGMPAPVLSGIRLLKNKIQDKKIQRKIDRALNYSATKQQPKKASNF